MSRTWVLTGGLVLLAVGCGKPASPSNPGSALPRTVAELKGQLNGERVNLRPLADGWVIVRPLCLELLRDPKSEPIYVDTVFQLVRVAADNSPEFRDVAVARMADQDQDIRRTAVDCLAKIGSERDTAPVALLLLDSSASVRSAAAKALVSLGVEREVQVFDLVLQNAEVYHHKDGQRLLWDFDVKCFTQCRDELKAKLKKPDEAK